MNHHTASAAPVHERVGDRVAVFPKLSCRLDLPSLGEAIRLERKDRAARLAKQKRFDQVEMYKVLLDVEWTPVSIRDIFKWAQSPEGAGKVLLASLKKGLVPDDEAVAIVEQIEPLDQMGLAARVVGAIPADQEISHPLK